MNSENLDLLIFPDQPSPAVSDYSRDTWIEIVQYTLNRFETFLGVPIEHEDFQKCILGQGFCVAIRSPAPAFGAFNITWKGIYSAGWYEESDSQHSYLNISATLFLYSNTKKLVTRTNESLLEYEYVRLNDKTITWRPFVKNAWMTDEFEEYEYYDDPDERFM